MAVLKKTDTSHFTEDVLNSKGSVMVDFWAEWCHPCLELLPVLEEVGTELMGSAQIFKVNISEEKDLADKYNIKGIPTMIFFKDGEMKKTLVGVQSKDEIKSSLEELF